MKAPFCITSLVVTLLGLGSCGYVPDATYRYKLTITVDTPDGEKSGFDIVQLDYFKTAEGAPHRTYGQALVLNLGARGTIVASLFFRQFLRGTWVERDPTLVILHACGISDSQFASMIEVVSTVTAKCTGVYHLEPSDLPTLVVLKNKTDSYGAVVANPETLSGKIVHGVVIRSATIEVTKDKVTTGVDDQLSWVRGWRGKIEAPEIFGTGPVHKFISRYDFISAGEG